MEVVSPGGRRRDCAARYGAEVWHEAEDALGLSAAERDGIAVGVEFDGTNVYFVAYFRGLPFGFVIDGGLVAVRKEAVAVQGR